MVWSYEMMVRPSSSGLWSRSRSLESESVESHVFSWSRSRESVLKSAGVGVGFLKLLESESGVGVGFSKLLESESGVGTFVAITDSNVY